MAERLKPESLYDRFIEFRESLGFEVLPLTGGERPPAEVLAERLRSNQFVCLMADRDLTRSGVPVEFFGEPTRMPAGPAKLAIETGAPLHPAHVYYDGQDCVVQIDDAIDTGSGDVRVIIQALADRFAVNIAAHPRTGTCFSHCGLPTSPTRAGPILRKIRTDGHRPDMRIGMVCPYSFDVPGGVQAHVLQLAEVMRARGHEVSVLAPSSPHVKLPEYVVSAGKAVPIPYNGSVARLRFGPDPPQGQTVDLRRAVRRPASARTERAEPLGAGLMVAEGPIVATFHTSTTKSLALSFFQGILRPWNEKIVGRIAVSDLARRWQMEALGADAVQIPNGVDVQAFASAVPLPGYPRPGKTVLFLGRFGEPRKGMSVLLGALPALTQRFPEVEILIVGRGDEDELRQRPARSPTT